MEKDELKKDLGRATQDLEFTCSKCHRVISRGEYYVRDILTKEITCMDCDDNRIYVNNENFMAIDEK